MSHKTGFVNIIGNPNVGKSTLMNALVGEKISIITSKAQTTRHRILGIVNADDFQIVYSDTPGIIQPAYELQESMMKFVKSALIDADVILYVTDIYETKEKNELYLSKLEKRDVPILLIINKIDLSTQENVTQLMEEWSLILPKATIIPVSALVGFNLAKVFDLILGFLPEGEPYFQKDALTDRTERFFVSEMIREKILKHYKQEIPYSVEVVVEEFLDSENLLKIKSIIYVMRESQKGIIIGKGGLSLKKIGTQAREDMEEFFGKKVFLEIQVKVNKEWRDKPKVLKGFGY